MTKDQLDKIIADENRDLERETVDRARDIIRAISKKTASIRQFENDIGELRAELKKLEVQQLDATNILGN